MLVHSYRGDALGNCGSCQVMSNPLILHGTQIALPKQRLPLNPNPNPLPRIPEGTAELAEHDASSASPESCIQPQGGTQMASPQAQLTSPQAQVRGPLAEVSSPQSASAHQPPFERQPAALRSPLSASMPLGSAASQAGRPAGKAALAAKEAVDNKDRDRTLNADDRLKRLKLRMQHTIQAYSGNGSSAAGAGRYSRSQSLTAASPHTAYHRMSSGPVRASRVSMCAVSQRSSADETSSCHSSSSCSSAAAPASVEGGAKAAAPGAVQCVPTQRGIPQVAFLLEPVCLYDLCSYWVWCDMLATPS